VEKSRIHPPIGLLHNNNRLQRVLLVMIYTFIDTCRSNPLFESKMDLRAAAFLIRPPAGSVSRHLPTFLKMLGAMGKV
jgi:hypothetical protein